MLPIITAFEESPDEGKGQARDMRVRWALEEVGQPYDVRLVSFREMKKPAHLQGIPSVKSPLMKKVSSRCSSQARSSCTSQSGTQGYCRRIRMRGCAQSAGCSLR